MRGAGPGARAPQMGALGGEAEDERPPRLVAHEREGIKAAVERPHGIDRALLGPMIETRADESLAVGVRREPNPSAGGLRKGLRRGPERDRPRGFLGGEVRPQKALALGKPATDVAREADIGGNDLGQVVAGQRPEPVGVRDGAHRSDDTTGIAPTQHAPGLGTASRALSFASMKSLWAT